MGDLDEIYERLARTWPSDELAGRYRGAERRRVRLKDLGGDSDRALDMVAAAYPPAATVSVALYVLHMLRDGAQRDLALRLIGSADQNAATGLRHCQLALELDGAAHSYTAEEWRPVICDIAGEILNSARLNEEPPTLVGESQKVIGWLSRAVVELAGESAEAPNTLSEILGRLLALCVFAETARDIVSG